MSNKNQSSDSSAASFKQSIYFFGGEKGGVGKSFACRCLVDYFTNRGWSDRYALVEADPTIGDVGSVYSNNCETVVFSDNKFDCDEPNVIVNKLSEKTVVVNLPANVSRQFDRWSKDIGLLSPEIKQYCEEIVYFFVTDGCYQSIEQFLAQIDKYSASDMLHCLVFNPGRLTCMGSFAYLERYKPLTEAIKKYNIPLVELPVLKSGLQFDCDREQLAYRDLLDRRKMIGERQNINTFLREVDRLFEQIFPNCIHKAEGLAEIAQRQSKYRNQNKLAFLHTDTEGESK